MIPIYKYILLRGKKSPGKQTNRRDLKLFKI